jgi:outer membrane receptor for ferrienterochelin and colicins
MLVLRPQAIMAWLMWVVSLSALAQTPAPQSVEIRGSAQVDERREATAAKLVLNNDDIRRYGDTSLPDLLRRVPGITLGGPRGDEVRMRGLGNGYTQILINGEPAPPGFSLDAISPALIERIEVQRSASADQSTQAIAGSINIVLKQTVRRAQQDLKLNASRERGHPSAGVEGSFADRTPSVSYSLAAALRHEEQPRPVQQQQTSRDAAGGLRWQREIAEDVFSRSNSLQLAPRLNAKLGERDSLGFDALLRQQQIFIFDRNRRTTLAGAAPLFVFDDLQIDLKNSFQRHRLNWTHNFSPDTTLDTKAGFNQFRREQAARFFAYGAGNGGDVLLLERTVDGLANDRSLSLAGKLRAAMGDTELKAHALAFGWDAESSARSESRIQRERTAPSLVPVNLDQVYDAQVRRLALFAQDEWSVTSQTSLYLGLRWEGLQTRSAGNTLTAVDQRSGVASPIVNVLWKEPGAQQWRLGLSRTYKAPNTRDLIARRFTANDNTATTPDFEGNPQLKPELAWSLDLGYERYLGPKGETGLLSASLYARRVDDVIQREVRNTGGVWVSRPVNLGRADVYGLELEGKLNLRKAMPDAVNMPALELRGNLAFNASKVAAVPGPNNRLDQQTPASANFSFDHRLSAAPLSWGASLAWQGGGPSRPAVNQFNTVGARKTLDLYALWKPSAGQQWRLSLNNALHPDRVDVNEVIDSSGSLRQSTLTPGAAALRLALELTL